MLYTSCLADGSGKPAWQASLNLRSAAAWLVCCAADSIYFPALPAVGKDLHASEEAVAATVAVFMFTVGLGNLFW
jgi:MFS family permease